jgi:hypothetical protein
LTLFQFALFRLSGLVRPVFSMPQKMLPRPHQSVIFNIMLAAAAALSSRHFQRRTGCR